MALIKSLVLSVGAGGVLLILVGCGGGSGDDGASDAANTTSEGDSATVTDLGGEPVTLRHDSTDGPDKNPLKGWNSGWWQDHPEASVGFQYLGWNDFEPEQGKYDHDAVERLLDRPGTKGRHFILRLYCDWFGEDETSRACPEWLDVDRLQVPTSGGGTKYVTDYNDPVYIEHAIAAINELAAHYDDDPRAFVFQIGVLGWWGEWHLTRVSDDDYKIADVTRDSILDAYRSAFSRVHLQGRYPWREPLQSTGDIGFHNDFFVAKNGHSDEFDEAVAQAEKWGDGPIGGEVPPLGDRDPGALYESSDSGDTYGMRMTETGRYSIMKPGEYRQDHGDPHRDEYMRIHKRMGYNFQVERTMLWEESGDLEMEVEVRNIGVAPMYMPWDVQFALLDDDDQPVVSVEVDHDLTSVLPDGVMRLKPSLALGDLDAETYRLGVRILQTGADEQKAEEWGLDPRNTYIVFANDLPVISGAWDDDHALIGGWSVLAEIAIPGDAADEKA